MYQKIEFLPNSHCDRSALIVQFGVILNDLPTIRINAIGFALNIAYICFFYNYTNTPKEKTQVFVQLGYGFAFVVAVIAYCAIENPVVLTFRYGMLLTAILFYLVGSPLLDIVSTTDRSMQVTVQTK